MNLQRSFYPKKAMHSIALLVLAFSSFGAGNISQIPMQIGAPVANDGQTLPSGIPAPAITKPLLNEPDELVQAVLPYKVCDPNGVDIGAYVATDPPTPTAVNGFEGLSGRHVCSVSWYQSWGSSVSEQPSFPSSALNAVLFHDGYDTSTILQLTWEPWVRLNDISTGKYDTYLMSYANQMKTWGRTIRLRFAHEMIEDDHYCWGQPGCAEWYPWQDQPVAYVAAFRHLHDVFTTVGASNVEFVWCANNYPFQMNIVQKYYPGDSYVDWLCMDGYNRGNEDGQPGWPDWQWFDDLFYNIYHTFVDHKSFFGDKPIMIGETASCESSSNDLPGQTKSAWITNMFQRLKSPDYARVKAFYWFHINKECDWRINSSSQSLSTFQTTISDPYFSSHPTPTVARFKSGGAQDGWALESSETSNQGGAINAAATFLLGDHTSNRQYRSILHFDTASLPDNAVIARVTLKIRKQGLTGTNPFTTHGKIAVDIRKGAFSNNAALQPADFQAAANKPGVGWIANTPQAGGWYVSNLKLAAYRYINRTGITQFRLRFQTDDDNDAVADFLRFFSGNAIAANRPVLVIEYYIP